MRNGLIEARVEKGLSVKETAEMFDISESFYYKIEAGIRNPNFILTKKIADYFKKDIYDLFFDFRMDETS